MTLCLASVIWIIWKLKQPRWQRKFQQLGRFCWQLRWTKLALGLAIASFIITSPPGVALAAQVMTSSIPPDSGETADAIVILGRGIGLEDSRIAAATALWQTQRAPQIFVSGIGDAPRMAQRLLKQGILATAIAGEGCSLTTEENAQFTANTLQPQGVKRIILITDPPHLLRSFLTFNSLGFEVIPHSAPLPATLGQRQETMLWLREYGGLLSYALLGRFSDR